MTGGIHQDITTNIPVIQQLSGSGVIFTSGVIMLLVEMLYQKFTMIVPHMYAYMVTQCVYFIPYIRIWYGMQLVLMQLGKCFVTAYSLLMIIQCTKVSFLLIIKP